MTRKSLRSLQPSPFGLRLGKPVYTRAKAVPPELNAEADIHIVKIVCILQSINYPERHYNGITSNLNQRLNEHNNGDCSHTSKYAPWQVLVSISFAEDARALAFERYLKSGSGRAFAQKHF